MWGGTVSLGGMVFSLCSGCVTVSRTPRLWVMAGILDCSGWWSRAKDDEYLTPTEASSKDRWMHLWAERWALARSHDGGVRYYTAITSSRQLGSQEGVTHGTAGNQYRNAVKLRRREGSIIGGIPPSSRLIYAPTRDSSSAVGESGARDAPLSRLCIQGQGSRVLSLSCPSPDTAALQVQVRRSAGLQNGKCHSWGTCCSGDMGRLIYPRQFQGISVSVRCTSKADLGLTDPSKLTPLGCQSGQSMWYMCAVTVTRWNIAARRESLR